MPIPRVARKPNTPKMSLLFILIKIKKCATLSKEQTRDLSPVKF